MLVEIAFRLPGDKIVDLIKLAKHVDLAKAMLLSYANMNYQPKITKKEMVAGIAFKHNTNNLKDYRDRIGFEIFTGESKSEVLLKMKKIWASGN